MVLLHQILFPTGILAHQIPYRTGYCENMLFQSQTDTFWQLQTSWNKK